MADAAGSVDLKEPHAGRPPGRPERGQRAARFLSLIVDGRQAR